MNWSLWWKCINRMKFINALNIYHCDENVHCNENLHTQGKICYCDETFSLWWLMNLSMMKFTTVIKYIYVKVWWKSMRFIKYHNSDKLIDVMIIYSCDKNSWLERKCITLRKIYDCEENLSLWWKFIRGMECFNLILDNLINVIEIVMCNKTFHCN